MRRFPLCARALAVDSILGDPPWIIHPVVLMGRAIQRLEPRLRALCVDTPQGEVWAGRLLVLAVAGGTLVASQTLLWGAQKLHPAFRWSLETIWGWQCLAMRDLWQEAAHVEKQLQVASLEDARRAVGRIVGRDTEHLSAQGVTRAAVESVAESFSDGIVAPMLYLCVGGAPAALCYKAINTMDSMVGYKSESYLNFGRAAAHTDDVANYLPSRIAALLLVASAWICREDAAGAWHIWRRDRRRHASPNSAQTESAMAGALGIELGGPAWYFGIYHDKPTIGDATRKPVPEDIEQANRLMRIGSILCLGLCGALAMAVRLVTRGIALPCALPHPPLPAASSPLSSDVYSLPTAASLTLAAASPALAAASPLSFLRGERT